jgi:serine/threonine-protein kinase
MAQPFNDRNFTLFGEPVPVAEQLGSFLSFGFFSASANGTLVYRTGSEALNSQLTWFDRRGQAGGRVAEPAIYASVTLSPDSSRAAVTRFVPPAAARDIWLIDFAKDTSFRFTLGPHANVEPIWSPDGRTIVFASDRQSDLNHEDIFDLYEKPANGSADEELLLKSIHIKVPLDVSRDGRHLLYRTQDPKTKGDLWMLPFDDVRRPVPVQATPFNEGRGTTLSSDGRWVAYESDKSGHFEVYVREFLPTSAGREWIVSKGGGRMPRSRRDGRELFYVTPDRILMSVDIATSGSGLHAGTPRSLFKLPFGYNQEATPWDVSADGNRFLIAVPLEENSRTPFTVVLNWPAGVPK